MQSTLLATLLAIPLGVWATDARADDDYYEELRERQEEAYEDYRDELEDRREDYEDYVEDLRDRGYDMNVGRRYFRGRRSRSMYYPDSYYGRSIYRSPTTYRAPQRFVPRSYYPPPQSYYGRRSYYHPGTNVQVVPRLHRGGVRVRSGGFGLSIGW